MINDTNKFTEIFSDLLSETQLSNYKFSKLIGVDHKRIKAYLLGSIPATETIAKICDYFKCSMDYITGLTEEFSYSNMKSGYNISSFMPEYQKLLTRNAMNHYILSKKGLVNESSLSWWKKGHLPQFEVIYNIAYELGGSIDKLLGRI